MLKELPLGFLNLVENSAFIKLSMEEDSGSKEFRRSGNLWVSEGTLYRNKDLAEYLSDMASDAVRYKLDVTPLTVEEGVTC